MVSLNVAANKHNQKCSPKEGAVGTGGAGLGNALHSAVTGPKDAPSSFPASWSGVYGNVYFSQQSKLLHMSIPSRPLSQPLLLLFSSSKCFFFLPLSELTDGERPLPAIAIAPEP